MHLRADIGRDRELLHGYGPRRRDGDVCHACGPACARAFLRRHAGNAHALALRQWPGAVAGQSHRGEQRVTQPLRAAVVLAGAVEQRDAELRGILAGRSRDLVDHAFDRPEGPARRHRAKLAGRRGIVRELVLDRAHIMVGHRVEEVRPVHREGIERPLLVDRGRQEIGDSPARCRPGRDHVMADRNQLAVSVHAGLHFLIGERTREIHRHVVLARVDHLDRLADGLRRLHGGNHHVGIETPAEAAAEPMLMYHDEFRIDPGGSRGDRAGARCELVAGIDVQDVALELRSGVHRLQRRVDVDAGGVLGLDHFRRRTEGRIGIAVLDEELAGILQALKPLGFIQQRLARQLRVRTAVIGDLERIRRLAGVGIGVGHCDDPAGRGTGLVVEDDGLHEAGYLLGLTVVDRFHRGAEAHRRGHHLAVGHARQHHIDAVLGRAVGLGGDVELRHRHADHGVLIRRLQLDRLQLVRREGFRRLAASDDLGKGHLLLRLRMRDHGVADHELVLEIGRQAHGRGGRLRQCDAAGSARTAHGIKVHHGRPAAAGDLRAQNGIVELRIVGGERYAHVAPLRPQLLADDLRHGGGDVLAHVGLAAGHGDEAIRRDRIPDARLEIGGRSRRRRIDPGDAGIAEHEAGRGSADEEGAAAEIGRRGGDVLDVLVHVGLRSLEAVDAVRISDAARMIAFWIRE